MSQLNLVDLAGSERVKKSLVRGQHVQELKAINLSLSGTTHIISIENLSIAIYIYIAIQNL